MVTAQDLIPSAQAGDTQAICALLALSQPDLRRYARVTCHADDIDDAVQDAMLILHRRLGALRKASALGGWLFVIVKRECIRLSKWSRRSDVDVETYADDPSLTTRTDHELRLDLSAAIQSLSPQYRNIVLLRDMMDMTIAEIAETTGDTRVAVKARLHRARNLIREHMLA